MLRIHCTFDKSQMFCLKVQKSIAVPFNSGQTTRPTSDQPRSGMVRSGPEHFRRCIRTALTRRAYEGTATMTVTELFAFYKRATDDLASTFTAHCDPFSPTLPVSHGIRFPSGPGDQLIDPPEHNMAFEIIPLN